MDEINKIRKLYYSENMSKNKLAKKFNRSWETIDRIIKTDREELATRGKRPNRSSSLITPEVIKAIEGYFIKEKEKKVRKKQRYTAKTIYKELKEQGIYKGSLRYVQDVIKALRQKHDQNKDSSYLPLAFSLGSSLQVDHGEVDIEIQNVRYKGYLFVASVPGYVLRYCQFFPVKSSEAWGEFHERAFNFFGGIFPTVIYDNDSVLVSKVLGRERKQTSFSLSLEEHYGFDSKFCNVASGNEKGAVENAVGYCRRNYLPGLPNFPDWNRVNTFLEESCKKEIKEGIHYKSKIPLQDSFESMQSKLIPLLPKKKWYKKSSSRVNSYQLITTNKKEYSVPEKYVGTYVNIFSSVFDIRILKNHEVIAQHSRIYNEPSVLQLDHYLDQLKYKPSALWDCQAVQKHTFDPNILEIWNRLEQRHNKKEANYQFVKILLLGRKYSQNDLQDAIKLSLLYGAIDSSAVENIICQMNTKQPYFDIEGVKSLLPNIKITSWDFDLNVYKELSKGVF